MNNGHLLSLQSPVVDGYYLISPYDLSAVIHVLILFLCSKPAAKPAAAKPAKKAVPETLLKKRATQKKIRAAHTARSAVLTKVCWFMNRP